MVTSKPPSAGMSWHAQLLCNSFTVVWRKLAVVVVTMSLCMLAPQLTPVDAANWGDIQKDKCMFPGFRKFYARLWNINGDWVLACQRQEAYVNGVYFPWPYNCVDKGFLGMWGEWKVQDSSCDPHWGPFKDDGCQSNGCRQFSSILWDIPKGVSWEDWCSRAWADISGTHYNSPSRCVNTRLNMWGEFDYEDWGCGYCNSRASAEQLDGAHHGDLGGLAGGLSPSSSPSNSRPSFSPSISPSSSPPSDVDSPVSSGSPVPWNR